MGALSIGEIMRNRELIKTIEKLSALLRKVT